MSSLIEWYRQSRSITWRGHRITCRTHGLPAAEATVLIHGFPTASWDWHAVWPALCALGPVLAFDMLGFGYSSKPHPHPYSLMDQADLVQDLCREYGVEKGHLLAHDYGDTVAQELLARTCGGPTLLSCFLLNGGIIPGQHRALPVQRLLKGPLGPLVARLMSRRRFGSSFAGIFGPHTQPTSEELDICWQLIEHHNGRRVMAAISQYQDERQRHAQRWTGALANSKVPTAALIGELDPISGAHMADAVELQCPNVAVSRLARIGHYPQLEDPEAVTTAYRSFRQNI